jgi:hypothetical protein
MADNVLESKSTGVLTMELYSVRLSIKNHYRYLHSMINTNYAAVDTSLVVDSIPILDDIFKDIRAVILEVEALKSRAVYLKKVIELKKNEKPLSDASAPVK